MPAKESFDVDLLGDIGRRWAAIDASLLAKDALRATGALDGADPAAVPSPLALCRALRALNLDRAAALICAGADPSKPTVLPPILDSSDSDDDELSVWASMVPETTALHVAAAMGDANLTELCLRFGGDPRTVAANPGTWDRGVTALACAPAGSPAADVLLHRTCLRPQWLRALLERRLVRATVLPVGVLVVVAEYAMFVRDRHVPPPGGTPPPQPE